LLGSIKFPDYKKRLHSGAIYTSRLLPTKEITRLLSQSQTISEPVYELKETSDLESLRIDTLKLNIQDDNQLQNISLNN
jgi:hypothetical protein